MLSVVEALEVGGMKFTPVFIQAMLAEVDTLTKHYPEILEDESLRLDMFEGSTDFNSILSYLVKQMRQAKADETSVQMLIEELAKKEMRHANKRKFFRALIQKVLEHGNIKKITLPEATVYTMSSPSKVLITDEVRLPQHLVRVVYEPDKKAIKSELERGRDVPGAVLSNGETTVVIR